MSSASPGQHSSAFWQQPPWAETTCLSSHPLGNPATGQVGDLIGRKRAYVLGLLGYAIGALAMALAQGLTAIIIFWAVLGGLGASLG